MMMVGYAYLLKAGTLIYSLFIERSFIKPVTAFLLNVGTGLVTDREGCTFDTVKKDKSNHHFI